MALVSINELPENILLEVFTYVPAHQLVLDCCPVCSLLRDLIDLVTLCKHKSLHEGFITEDCNEPVSDWKIYFLCSLRRNLLRNPCAEEGLRSWQIDYNGGDHWKAESLPGGYGQDFPTSKVRKYFVTSFGLCLKSQMVDLKAEGYWEELMDIIRPDIVVKDWFAARADCGCTYNIEYSWSQPTTSPWSQPTTSRWPPPSPHLWNNAQWTEVSHTFSVIRHNLFQHGGKDTQFWAGWYGPPVTNSSIIISPKTPENPAASTTQPKTTQEQEQEQGQGQERE